MNRVKLKELVDSSKLSQTEILKRANITRPTLTAIYNGSDPRVSVIESLAMALGVSPAVFFDDSPSEYQSNDHGTINGHHQHHININDSKVLEKTINEIAEHRKLIEKSQEHISDLTKALLNLTTNKKKK